MIFIYFGFDIVTVKVFGGKSRISALAVIEFEKAANLIAVPVREFRGVSRRIQEQMCGAYAMEYDEDSANADLISELRGMMQA